MTWYKTGTVSVTNGSPTVTLSGGDAQLNIFPDDGFVGPDGRTYAILQVDNATTFILSQNYVGPTISGQNYVIIPTADHVQLRDMLIGVNTLVDTYEIISQEAGAGRFPNGTALEPGVRGITNPDTGLRWNVDGSLSIIVNGVEAITFSGAAASPVITVNGKSGPNVTIEIGDIAGLVDDLNAKIDKSIFTTAQQILFSTGTNTPAASVAVGINSLIGRAASGNIKGLSAAEARTNLGINSFPASGNIVGTTDTQTLTSKTLTNPTIDGYTEGSATATGSAFSPNLAADTLFYYTTNANATITLPTPAVGKSFMIQVQYGGTHTLSWAGGARKWSGGTVPTNTSANGKVDIFSFVSDAAGANWLASQSGKNF